MLLPTERRTSQPYEDTGNKLETSAPHTSVLHWSTVKL